MANAMDQVVRSNRFSAYLLFGVVALTPLPFGSTDAITVAVWCVVLGVATAAATPRILQPGQFLLLGCAGILIAAYALVLHEQLSSHPWFAAPDPIWGEASEALGIHLRPSVSIARNQPFFALGPPLAVMLSLICSFIVCADRARAQRLIKVIAWSGVIYAVFAIVTFVVDPTHILWRTKQAYDTVLTGTFINRNTAAVYFGMCSMLWLLGLAEKVRSRLPSKGVSLSGALNLILSLGSRDVRLLSVMLFICLAAMFMTGSRAGIVLSLMALVVSMIARFYRDLRHRRSALTVVVFGVVGSLALLQVMGAGVNGRFDAQGLSDEGRFETYRATWRMIADHPWFGTGLGTFAWGFPAYRSSAISVWGVWDRAHNTLLEIAAEMGLPIAGLVVVGWVLVFAVLLRGILRRRRDLVVPVAAFSGAMLAVLHSLIDFSLQIPGYAIGVFALVGAGLAQSFSSRVSRRGSSTVETVLPTMVIAPPASAPAAVVEAADGMSSSSQSAAILP
jgi:O-antigen ligase